MGEIEYLGPQAPHRLDAGNNGHGPDPSADLGLENMSDADFARLFPPAALPPLPVERPRAPAVPRPSPAPRPPALRKPAPPQDQVAEFEVSQAEYKGGRILRPAGPGQTTAVELADGSFLRILSIWERYTYGQPANSSAPPPSPISDQPTVVVILRGLRFLRTKKCHGYLPLRRNEVALVHDHSFATLAEVVRVRQLIMTGSELPHDNPALTDPRADDETAARLVCRWKMALPPQNSVGTTVNGEQCAAPEGYVRRLAAQECHQDYRVDEATRRQRWRCSARPGHKAWQQDSGMFTDAQTVDHGDGADVIVLRDVDASITITDDAPRRVSPGPSPGSVNSKRPVVGSEKVLATKKDRLERAVEGTSRSSSTLVDLTRPQPSLFSATPESGTKHSFAYGATAIPGGLGGFEYLTIESAPGTPKAHSPDPAPPRTPSRHPQPQLHRSPQNQFGGSTSTTNTSASGRQQQEGKERHKERQREKRGHRYTFGDSFCGAGGMSSGARASGFTNAWAFDFNHPAWESYRRNFCIAPDGPPPYRPHPPRTHPRAYSRPPRSACEALHCSVDEFIAQATSQHVVDVLHLSPPCQPHSPAHTIAGKDDEMNEASMLCIAELLQVARPRVATLEQTFGILRRPEWFAKIVNQFTICGYSVAWKLLRCIEFGVPQNRVRLFLLAAWYVLSLSLLSYTYTYGFGLVAFFPSAFSHSCSASSFSMLPRPFVKGERSSIPPFLRGRKS